MTLALALALALAVTLILTLTRTLTLTLTLPRFSSGRGKKARVVADGGPADSASVECLTWRAAEDATTSA